MAQRRFYYLGYRTWPKIDLSGFLRYAIFSNSALGYLALAFWLTTRHRLELDSFD